MSSLILPGNVVSSPWGKLQPYDGISDATMFLWDAAVANLSVVPTTSQVIPNLLRDRVAALSGLSAANCELSAWNNTANGFAVGEITAKKGIHVASTQAGSQTGSSWVGLQYTTAFANWLMSQMDAGADYGVISSMWLTCTRSPLASSPGQSMAHLIGNSTATYGYLLQTSSPVSGSPLIGGAAPPVVVGETKLAFASSQGWTGTKPANLNNDGWRSLAALGANSNWAGITLNKCGSYILYRAALHFVDLTDLSAGSKVEKANAVMAAETAAYNAAFAEGGKYYGDTFTPPTTLKN